MTSQRRDAGIQLSAVVETIELDFTKKDFQKELTFNFLALNLVSVFIRQVGCTAIAGNWVLKQCPDDSGADAVDFPEGALTSASAVTGVSSIIKGTLTMEYAVLILPTTLPAVGKAIIHITAKR